MLLNTCTLVTCYYATRTKKHSTNEYAEWMHNFLTTVESPLIVYCEKETVPKIQELRGNLPTHIVEMPFQALDMSQDPYQSYFRKDFARDPEKSKNDPMLFAIWNEKTKFVQRAIKLDPFDTQYFCWIDIGCFRTKVRLTDFHRFPHGRRLQEAKVGKLHVLQVYPFFEEDMHILPNGLTRSFHLEDRIGGTIFLGDRDAWQSWSNAYYKTLHDYMDADYFAGDDQDIMATTIIKHPTLVHVVQPTGCKGDPWFYLQEYFTYAH